MITGVYQEAIVSRGGLQSAADLLVFTLSLIDSYLFFAKFLQNNGDLSEIPCRSRKFFEFCNGNVHFVAEFAKNFAPEVMI